MGACVVALTNYLTSLPTYLATYLTACLPHQPRVTLRQPCLPPLPTHLACRRVADDCGRQLQVVPSQHSTRGFEQRTPCGSLQGLSCLIDHHHVKDLVLQGRVAREGGV